jgi:hypothetical protein
VRVLSQGFANLGPNTTIAGGTLNAPNGVVVNGGSILSGYGTVNGKVSANYGSTIQATGTLAIGDSTAYGAFASNGELQVGANAVTINSRNAAQLGSLTTLGDGGGAGTLNIANGAVVDFGRAVTGYGTINTPNNAAKALVNNGDIVGNSPSQPITLTGYVKGVGTLDNVAITGTYSPGLSPAQTFVGNLLLTDTSSLVMEIGGTQAGSQYDQLITSGLIEANGTLDIELINGFMPQAGDTFQLFQGNLTGQFDSVSLPGLSNGMSWDTSSLYTGGTITSVPEPATIAALIGLVGMGAVFVWRKRRKSSRRPAEDVEPEPYFDD